ncbi:MAG: hypothetical protein KGL11_01845 [Alphaproteobacteria bacterium]|nr:hypothetical protein [Alphaproteobacteria bacterium]
MQPNPKIDRRRRRLRHWLIGTVAVIAVAGSVMAVSSRNDPARMASGEPAIPHGVKLASWEENGRDGQYVLQIADGGTLPSGAAVTGTVTSDTNCAPDAQGLSHCRNGIALSNGSRITVIDIHTMSRNPCLLPGETITLTRIDSSWLVASKG